MHQTQTSKNVISQGRSNEGFTTLEIVHRNVCGPMRTILHGGAQYFFTFINNFSRKTHVYFLKTKGKAFEKFKQYKALVKNKGGHKIKVL
jgi:uncharacterized protein YigE (DUF2233 family)